MLACSALNDLMLLLNVEKTLVLYSIVSDIPKNELMTIREIARVTIELIKNIAEMYKDRGELYKSEGNLE